MRAILPGRPQSKLQSLSTCLWDGLRVIAYLSGNAVIILGGPETILQSLHINDVDSLEAIAIEENTGTIAVSGGHHIFIYQPYGREEGCLHWAQQHVLNTQTGVSAICLSWASEEELLAAGESLRLWSIAHSNGPLMVWNETLPSPIRLAYFSHDGCLIASVGHHDRLVKIWRRLSYEVDSTRFDVSYLQHPRAVTNLHWRKPWHAEQSLDNLLYTFCSDDRIRVWAHSDPFTHSVMQLVAEIDMQASIQPRMLPDHTSSRLRYAFVVDSRAFSRATENAVQSATDHKENHALEHLVEVAGRSPEVCVIMDDLGHISAWGVENAGYKNRQPTTVFNIVHVQGMRILLKPTNVELEDHVMFCIFAGGIAESSLTVLAHYFHGRIDWYDAPIAHLFDAAPRDDRAQLISSWTGHDAAIEAIYFGRAGDMVLTSAANGTKILWQETRNRRATVLERYSTIPSSEVCVHARFLNESSTLAMLHERKLTIWDTRKSLVKHEATTELSPSRQSRHILPIGQIDDSGKSAYFGVVSSDMSATLWGVKQPHDQDSLHDHCDGVNDHLYQLCTVDCSKVEHSILVSHEYAGLAGPLQQPATVWSVSSNGLVQKCSLYMAQKNHAAYWKQVNKFQTGILKPHLLVSGPAHSLAIVNSIRTDLSLWDSVTGELEHQWHCEETESIEELGWTSSAQGSAVLGVGLAFRILIMAPVSDGQCTGCNSWSILKEIKIRDFTTHALGSMTWLSSGVLAFGAGQQIFVEEQTLELGSDTAVQRNDKLESKSTNVLRIVDQLSATCALFHPRYLVEAAINGQIAEIHQILLLLHQQLKFFTNSDVMPSFLGINLGHCSQSLQAALNTTATSQSNGMDHNLINHEAGISNETVEILIDRLQQANLQQLSQCEHKSLIRLIRSVLVVEPLCRSVDVTGFRYICASEMDDIAPSEGVANWRNIVFASHSISQHILVDLVTRSAKGKLTWEAARKSGIFLWLSGIEAARSQMEVVARNEYIMHEDRNPVDCSLYYLALQKKQVLQGLWRMSVGIREKENTMKLLAHNFNEPRWRATALKNAYALISKRRFEYAAAFFLLAGSLKDAVNVCVHQLKQIELGIAIARVHGGDEGPVLRDLLTETVLPQAADSGNRWMASWAFQKLGQQEKAVQAFVRPLHTLVAGASSDIEGASVGTKQAKSWRNNEPCQAFVYKELRAKLVKERKWVNVIEPNEEWKFILRCASHYRKMGCHLLAVELLRGWEFVRSTPQPSTTERSTSLLSAEPTAEGKPIWEEDVVKKKPKQPPPTQFQEPSASSLLDSFGF